LIVHQKAINYYDCYTKEVKTDTRGYAFLLTHSRRYSNNYTRYIEIGPVEGDPHFIDEKNYCDAVIDCDNWSDEGWF